MTDPTGDIDFFISYRGAQADWARWVNWVVRSAGYSTMLMDEFQVGNDWLVKMEEACKRCHRLIPLLSESYWQSQKCLAEFRTYWQWDSDNLASRFLLPLAVGDFEAPALYSRLLWKPLHTLTRDAARAAILKVLEGITPLTLGVCTESEPPFPSIAPAPATVIDWPDTVDELKWPLADHDEARLAFAELVTRTASFKLLAIKGSSETGKSHLTDQFITNAQRRVTACRCARFDFKGTDQIDQTLATFVQHLDVPLPPAAPALSDGFRHILQNLGQRQQPSLLVFDTYEDAGDTDRWVRESLLTSLHRHPWLRVVIAGQEVPACHGNAWAEDSKLLRLNAPRPDHWMAYAVACGRTITATTLEEVHLLTGGKASILAQLCGPYT